MIGTLIFHLANERHVAELDQDLTWRCEIESVARMLNENFPIYQVDGEDAETLGRHSLYRAAYRLGGEVRLPTITGGRGRLAGV